MTDDARTLEQLRRATAALRDARRRLREVEADRDRAREPIAIVGMACRYPGGVGTPEQLWELVAAGGDAVTAFPADRGWDLDGLYHPDAGHPGTSYTREGAFLDDVAGFDAAFFGISPREAEAMDPQQRLLLEVTWEALERAGIDPHRSAGRTPASSSARPATTTARPGAGARHRRRATSYTGNADQRAVRPAGLRAGLAGPAVTLDTACSSSLVALHLAAQALRAGDCDLAARRRRGGAWRRPGCSSRARRQRAAGRGRPVQGVRGRRRTAPAWGEGVGVVLLERLSDARRARPHGAGRGPRHARSTRTAPPTA